MRRWYVRHAVSGARCALYATYTVAQVVIISNSGGSSCCSCVFCQGCFGCMALSVLQLVFGLVFGILAERLLVPSGGRVWVTAGATATGGGGSEGVAIARHTAKCQNFSAHTHRHTHHTEAVQHSLCGVRWLRVCRSLACFVVHILAVYFYLLLVCCIFSAAFSVLDSLSGWRCWCWR